MSDNKRNFAEAAQPAIVPIRHNRLKVLFLNYEFPPSGGGAGNATYQTALEMSRRGHDVDVLTARLPNQPAVDKIEKLTIHRVLSYRRSVHESGLLGTVIYLVAALGRLRSLAKSQNYDLFHFYFGLPTGLLGLYVRFVLRKPYIISLRGSDVPGYDTTRWYLQPLHIVLRPVSRYLWSHAASVIALSRHLRDLAQLTTPQLDIKVIGNAVDAAMFPKKPASIHPDPIRLICVCRLVKRKGLIYLIDAMREMRNDDVTLQIVGTGDNRKEIESLIDQSDVAHNITMVGYVPRECLVDYYHDADVFVLPSLSESFGQVIVEAMSCGLPVVASRVGGIPETIEHGVNGLLVEPASSQALVSAIRRLISEPGLRSKIGANNARQARAEFSWAAVAARYEEVYLQAIHSEARKSRRQA